MLNIMNPPADWSTLKKLIWLKAYDGSGTGIEQTVSGATPLHFSNALAKPMSITTNIKPVQDLHGYDAPWPAGGGKNKFNGQAIVNGYPSISECTTELGTGTYTLSLSIANATNWRIAIKPVVNDAVASDAISVTSPDGYYWNANASAYLAGSNGNNNKIVFTVNSACKIGVSIVLGDVSSSTVVSNVQVESGSTATSYAPYENICPISGWDEVNVWDDSTYGGTVEWNQLLRNGNFENTSNWSASAGSLTVSNNIVTVTKNENTGSGVGYIRQTAFRYVVGHKYFATIDYKGIAGKQLTVFSNSASAGMEQVIPADSEWHTLAKIFDVSGTPSVPSIAWLSYATTVGDNVAYFRNYNIFDLTAMFGAGNEPTTVEEFRALFPNDYYAYNAGETMTVSQVNGEAYRHYTIEMPTEAGTVYGGELTVNKDGSGQLVVDRAEADMGTLSWTKWTNDENTFVTNGLPNIDDNNQQMLCEAYAPLINGSSQWGALVSYDMRIYHPLNDRWVLCRDTRYDNASSFKESVQGVRVVYPLATPITYTLTATQIKALKGDNNIWTDCGDEMSVTYVAKA